MDNFEVLMLIAVGVFLILTVGQFGVSDHKESTLKSKGNKKRVKKTAPKVAKQEVVKKAVIKPVLTESSKTDFERSIEKKTKVINRFREKRASEINQLAYTCPGCSRKVVATYFGSKVPEASECFECVNKVKTYDADEAKVIKTNNKQNIFQKSVAENKKSEEVKVAKDEVQASKVEESDDLAKLRLKVRMAKLKNKTRLI
jgi:hypothetical protein